MAHVLLRYTLAPNYLDRRATFRAEHLALAWAAAERGELLLGGATGDPVDGALLLFAPGCEDAAADFARADPYVTTGLVEHWAVVPWTTVVGEAASTPVRS
jgi:uncharacterized protein YciI